jgi:ATP-binding cassette subfamily C (CFTR/MRP) protein 1
LATNSLPVLMEANYIVLLREGRILERGTYEQLMAMKGEISQLIKTASNEESQDESQSETPGSDDSATVFETDPNSAASELEITEAEEGGEPQLAPINKEFSEQGKVKWNVYSEYAKTSNLVAVAIYIVTLVGAQTAQIGKCVPGLC